MINYVQPSIFDEVVTLLHNRVKQLPTGEVRDIKIPFIRGPMGCGKTTMAVKVVEEVSRRCPDKNIINCYVRLDFLLSTMRDLATMTDATSILASALLYAFTGLRSVRENLQLSEVASHIVSDLGSNFVILHLDEFQVNLKVSEAIIAACKITMASHMVNVCIMPILSGISNFGPNITEPSGLSSVEFHLGTLPEKELWKSFVGSLKRITKANLDGCKNLRCLFNDCGLFAHQVVHLVDVIQSYNACHDGLAEGALSNEHANVICKKVMERLGSVYGPHRWHSLVMRPTPEHERVLERASWESTTKPLVAQVVLHAAAGKLVSPNDSIRTVKNKIVSWQDCENSGVIGLVPKAGSEALVACSLFAMMVMNSFAEAIPISAGIESSFEDDWQTLERVALVSWMIHMKIFEAGSRVQLGDCRPGAFVRSSAKVEITVPKDFLFEKATAFLSPQTQLTMGKFLLAFPNEVGVDGIVLFDGFVKGRARKILVLSQTKKQGHRKTGEQAPTSMLGADIKKILDKMKEVVKTLPKAVQKAFVVYDVFSDRFGAIRGLDKVKFNLGVDEALIVTTSGEIDSVLGGLAARKREVPT